MEWTFAGTGDGGRREQISSAATENSGLEEMEPVSPQRCRGKRQEALDSNYKKGHEENICHHTRGTDL